MSSSNANFPVGNVGKRELRRALLTATDPEKTIAQFQQDHSLHTMMSRAFGTIPKHQQSDGNGGEAESLDTDSVMTFLSHLGVSQHEVHKRISDTLLKDLEDEIRKSESREALLDLLKSSWTYASTIAELRPVLWAVLKKLGDNTPQVVLIALAERKDESSNDLKHYELFKPLPKSLKQLVWEADWSKRISGDTELKPKECLEQARSTLVFETAEPFILKYLANSSLVEIANKTFTASIRECRMPTTHRRVFAGKGLAASGRSGSAQPQDTLDSGKAISRLRDLLSDTSGSSSVYRPKLLYAILTPLIAMHSETKVDFLGGSEHLHCTLVADILLSTGGPLPKAYQDILSLARLLDECVQEGNISDSRIAKVQEVLRAIFRSDDDGNPVSPQKKETGITKKKDKKKELSSSSIQRQLDRIITSCLVAIKEADAQHLFTNPVTDEIAPGYSRIIKYPMSISTMESKVESHEYKSPSDWEKDVELMYKNCLDYNRGTAGQWFRGEAKRQREIFQKEVLPQARRLYQKELSKIAGGEALSGQKRKSDGKEEHVRPLAAANKKRRESTHDKDESLPNMPCLAFMLLSDPFVVRIFMSRVLRDLRRGVMAGSSLPVSHGALPSLLQLLHMANWSAKVCSINAKLYPIPDSGVEVPVESTDPAALIPFATLRRVLPLLLRLQLEAELDRRIIYGGNLYETHQVMGSRLSPKPTPEKFWAESSQVRVAVALLQGSLVHLCLPDSTTDHSLSVSFPKYALALQQISQVFLDDRTFFLSMIAAIRRHKQKISKATRDAIVNAWIGWLSMKEQSKKGTILCAVHECFLILLSEWYKLGNQVLPRDDLVKFSGDAVRATEGTESRDSRKLSSLWFSDNTEFRGIREQYEIMLRNLPDTVAQQWQVDFGVAEEESEQKDSLPVSPITKE